MLKCISRFNGFCFLRWWSGFSERMTPMSVINPPIFYVFPSIVYGHCWVNSVSKCPALSCFFVFSLFFSFFVCKKATIFVYWSAGESVWRDETPLWCVPTRWSSYSSDGGTGLPWFELNIWCSIATCQQTQSELKRRPRAVTNGRVIAARGPRFSWCWCATWRDLQTWETENKDLLLAIWTWLIVGDETVILIIPLHFLLRENYYLWMF